MTVFSVTVYLGNRNANNYTIAADDAEAAAFLACCELEKIKRFDFGNDYPLVRYDERKNRHYVNGVPVTVLPKGSSI